MSTVTKTMKIGLSTSDKATMSNNIKAAVNANVASDYSTSATYEVGDLVLKDGSLYRCKTAITTAESWTAAHWEAKKIGEIIADFDKDKLSKGDFDGTTGVGYSDAANNLTPYSDESGVFQDNPTISQGTGTDNNTAIVTTGDYAQLREKQGNTVVVNQLIGIPSSSITATKNGVTFTDNRDGTYTVNGTATGGDAILSVAILLLNGGKRYLLTGNKQTNSNYSLIFTTAGSTYATDNGGNAIYTPSSDIYMSLSIVVKENSTASNLKFEPKVVELKQMFNGNIPQDLLDHPDHFSWYYNGPLTYDAGSLENSNGVKLVCTGRNLFDENSLTGKTGITKVANGWSGNGSSWNDIDLRTLFNSIPNRKYALYAKITSSGTGSAFASIKYEDGSEDRGTSITAGQTGISYVVPSQANENKKIYSIRISYGSGSDQTFIVTDICVSLYYTPAEGGEGYDQHYDYEEPTVVDTGSETLYGVEGSRDVKLPDGTITHRRGRYTFTGNEVLTPYSTGHGTYTYICQISGRAANTNVLFAQLSKTNATSMETMEDNTYRGSTSSSGVIFYSTSYQTEQAMLGFLTGKTIEYDLAEPTTSAGTPFPENIDIDDYGMMYWLDENDELVGIPQGAKFFYPVNYKGFTDDLYNRTGGDAGDVVIQSELSASETARDTVDAQFKEALGGTLRQLLAVKESIDFDNTKVIDLSELSYVYSSEYQMFTGAIADIQKATDYGTAGKIMSTSYKTISVAQLEQSTSRNMVVAVDNSQSVVRIRNTAYTDATAFKAAMKNVLLAYEKASE